MKRIWPLICATLTLSGCATFDGTNYRQIVLVKSSPSGAKIFDQGEQVGVTPAYVPVRRRTEAEIQLRFADGALRNVPLTSSYRWNDSFYANLLFLVYAPVGWGVDYLTGTAWKFDDPPEVRIADGPPAQDRLQVVAVAPPHGADRESVDAVGSVIESKLSATHQFKVLDYENTAPIFTFYHSDHGISDRPEERNQLYFQLGADHVFLSKVEARDNGFLVTGNLQDVYTGQNVGKYSWDIVAADEDIKSGLSADRFFNGRFHFIPNTVFLNASNFEPTVTVNEVNYKGTTTRGHAWYQEAFNAISFVNFSHLERPRRNVVGHWVFDFVPLFNLSSKRISFDTYAPIQGTQFDRLYLSGGYGLESGYMSRFGFVYLDIVPTLTWTQIGIHNPSMDQKLSDTSVTATVELGYSYFMTDHLVAKLFLRSLSEDNSLWRRAFERVSGKSEELSSLSSAFYGVAVGYHFPSSLIRKNGWRAKKMR